MSPFSTYHEVSHQPVEAHSVVVALLTQFEEVLGCAGHPVRVHQQLQSPKTGHKPRPSLPVARFHLVSVLSSDILSRGLLLWEEPPSAHHSPDRARQAAPCLPLSCQVISLALRPSPRLEGLGRGTASLHRPFLSEQLCFPFEGFPLAQQLLPLRESCLVFFFLLILLGFPAFLLLPLLLLAFSLFFLLFLLFPLFAQGLAHFDLDGALLIEGVLRLGSGGCGHLLCEFPRVWVLEEVEVRE